MQDPHQHGPAQANAPAYDSSSVSSTASPRVQFAVNNSFYHSTPPSRPGSGLNPHHPIAQPVHHVGRYEPTPGMLADLQNSMSESQFMAGQGMLQPPMAQIPQQNQKRAYRQRRKDPSCDACRERKVKCDATETTSCSECSSRNVRCQFTKETNRRMSSIKQVQDLEKQLHQARQQLHQYQAVLPRPDGAMDLDEPTRSTDLPRVGAPPQKRPKPPLSQDLSHVRSNIRDFGRGVIRAPAPYRLPGFQLGLPPEIPSLPPRALADSLLGRYYDCIHSVYPIVHWPTFHDEYLRVYQKGDLTNVPREWSAVLFSMLACGCIYTDNPNRITMGKSYLAQGNGMLDVWQDDFPLDQARAAFLFSIFLMEMNLKSASWVWYGAAVRIVQDIGLHVQTGPWSPIEGEMRKRVWYCVYAWDRLLALEFGKPMLINDDDFDTEYPEPVDDKSITDDGIIDNEQPSTSLLAVIHVARSLQQMTKLFKSPFITAETLRSRDDYLAACMSSFPKHLLLTSHEPLDPNSLPHLIYYQNARFMLHRHNLSPSAPPELRILAIDSCSAVAHDTIRLMSRCMVGPDGRPNENWRVDLAMASTTHLCTHLWRCTLILLLGGEYSSALSLVQVSAAIGAARAVNVSCGRHISFFLSTLYDRLQNGRTSHFEQDEEMMAYVSADLQTSADGSWIWQGSETGDKLSHLIRPKTTTYSLNRVNFTDATYGSLLSEEETSNWGGWERIEHSLHYLLDDRHRQAPSTQTYASAQYPDSSRNTLPPMDSKPPNQSASQPRLSPEIPRLNTKASFSSPAMQQQQQQQQPSGSKSLTGTISPPTKSPMDIANII